MLENEMTCNQAMCHLIELLLSRFLNAYDMKFISQINHLTTDKEHKFNRMDGMVMADYY